MKKTYIIFFIIVLLFSLVACGQEAEDESQADNPTAAPESAPQETAVYSPTPEPTLSEEQKRILEKYTGLLVDCERYNDWSAAVMLKEMYDAGEISDIEFYKLAQVPGFEDTRDLSDEVWAQVKDHVVNIADILNGGLDSLNEAGMEKFYNDLCAASVQGTVYINALDTQEKKDRSTEGIRYISQWIEDSTEANFGLVEEACLSEELTSGEIVLLGCYMYHADGEDEERTAFLDEHGVQERLDEAYIDLLEGNNK